jgi:hypothetical protein
VRCGNALANMAAIQALDGAIGNVMIAVPDGTPAPGLSAGATVISTLCTYR